MGVEGVNKFKELNFGDHICLLYSNKDEYRYIVINYILEGIYNNEKVICTLHEYPKEMLIQDLKDKDSHVDNFINSNKLIIRSINDIYSGYSRVNIIEILDYWEKKKIQMKEKTIKKEGFVGIRLLTDMTFRIYEDDGTRRLIEHELYVNKSNLENEVNLCIYNKESFPNFVLEEVIQSHNVLIDGKDIIKPNPYYLDYEKQLECHKRRLAIRTQLDLGTCHNLNPIQCSSERKNRDANILKHVLGSVGDGVWEWHVESEEVYINNSFFHILGYNNDKISLKVYNITKLIHPDDIHGFRNQLNKCCRNEIEHIDYELRIKNKKGQWIDFRIRGIVLSKDELFNKALHLVGIYVDITEGKRIKDELDEKNSLEQLKLDFVSNLFHELKTPLNVILGSLQLQEFYIKNDKNSENVSKYSKINKRMKQNSYRLLRLINNVIDVAKIESGFYNIKSENYDIKMLIEKIVASIDDYVRNAGLAIKFEFNTDELIIACDPEKMEKILLNILSNAIKFTEPGGSIYIKLNAGEDRVNISIKDTGIGIPKDKIEKVFDRFKQVNSLKHRANEGSGIGLYLVKEWILAHKGEIFVKSKENEGTEFIIKLPNKKMVSEIYQEKETACTKEVNVEKLTIEFSDIYS